jgi:cyclopropane-fatty-acyl-phospholipid synthase
VEEHSVKGRAEAPEAHRDGAVAMQSEEVYQRYVKYLSGCADAFRSGHLDVSPFTPEK